MNDKILILSNLVKTFEATNEKLVILDNLNFEISTPQKIVITGESGAGKSTLLNIIAGLDAFNSGEIYAKNYEVHKLDEKELSNYRINYLGLVFQFHYLLRDFTALENVMLPALIAGIKKHDAKAKAIELLDDVKLANRLDHYPSQLSGGERQRVAVARALINSPNLILADEPTGNLDKNNAQLVKELLFSVVDKHKKTLILVTHDIEIAKSAEAWFSLEAGKLKKL
ncbi:MAG: ABC transporter ATP-binding protein [Treponema sp.]